MIYVCVQKSSHSVPSATIYSDQRFAQHVKHLLHEIEQGKIIKLLL